MKITILALFALAFAYWLGSTQATGILSIRFLNFDSKGKTANNKTCDRYSDCDPAMKICFGFANSSEINCTKHNRKRHSRSFAYTSQYLFHTEIFFNTDIIEFGDTIGYYSNPLVYSTSNDFNGMFGMKIAVFDRDLYYYKRKFKKIDQINVDADIDRNTDLTKKTFMGMRESDKSALSIEYKLCCDPNFYGEFCTIYCKPGSDDKGEYTCDCTGEKQYNSVASTIPSFVE